MTSRLLTAGAVVAALAVSTPAFAQGNSQNHQKSSPPSKSKLPAPSGVGGSIAATTPFGWLDDASVLEPGAASLGLSVVRWVGTDASETNAPVVDVGLGIAPRVQLTANIPRVLAGNDPGSGGFGTSYVGAKIGVLDDSSRGLKLAVSPTLEILGAALASALGPDVNRVQWGLPASVELDRGAARAYAGGGYFSRGVWFAGAGAAVQPASNVALSAAFTRSWTSASTPDVALADRARNEISGGAFYALTPGIGVFGSIGHTVATTDANGGGATFAAGISFTSGPSPARRK
jgi:hypothetical protein